MSTDMQQLFNQLSATLMGDLLTGEHLALSIAGENSIFIRFSQAKIRQSGVVEEAELGFSLIHEGRRITSSISLSGRLESDLAIARNELIRLRLEVVQLPQDPYLVIPDSTLVSCQIHKGHLPSASACADELVPPMQGVDLAGIWASGRIYKGSTNSAGGSHWFARDSFSLDYSLISTNGKMVKSTFAGTDWNPTEYREFLQQSINKLELMTKPAISIEPGAYRTFIASAGVADLLGMFSWNGLGEAGIQQQQSAFGKMRNQGAVLASGFSLAEDFTTGLVPRFNDDGEMAPECMELIGQGALTNTLVSSRTATEYELACNFAAEGEYLRSPNMAIGELQETDILAALGTGIYLSNLHYLNWSDMIGGRITGMTRYACFWVEEGVIKGPIENMRFEGSIYQIFGDNLQAVTDTAQVNPDVGTYSGREFSATVCPGILLKSFQLTL